MSASSPSGFRLIYEVEPPREPDLSKFARQLEIFGGMVDAVLIPDNHLGRPALSSVALAIEARRQGFTPIVALNARDRNHLRFRSDLMTLSAFGIEDVLLLYGDTIDHGRSDLTVRSMLAEDCPPGLRRGVVAPMDKPLAWRRPADYVFTQLGEDGLACAARLKAEGWTKPVYGGTGALQTRALAERVTASIPGYTVCEGYFDAFDADPDAGFRDALRCMDVLIECGADGAHLVVPTGRRRFAELLAEWVVARDPAPARVVESPV
ncbi:MAG TPA: methylenetetrahydrofolate reductase [Actinomycetota bacterium]|nr:methylenetetrahydrofolate reductase [Actinomycetota bacterium]